MEWCEQWFTRDWPLNYYVKSASSLVWVTQWETHLSEREQEREMQGYTMGLYTVTLWCSAEGIVGLLHYKQTKDVAKH